MNPVLVIGAICLASLLLGLATGAVLRWCGRHDEWGEPLDRAQAELIEEER